MISGKTFTYSDILPALRRRKWLILIPFVVVSAATVAVTHSLPDKYQSETLILVVPQRVPEAYVRPTVTTLIEDRLQTIGQQILSRTRLESIILEFDLYREARRESVMQEVVEAMRDDIEIQVVRGDSFRLSYVNEDPQIAMQVTNRLASMFIEENLRERQSQAQGTTEFLESQLADANRRLIAQEKILADFRREHAVELPTQQASNLQAVQNLQLQIQALQDAVVRDRDRRASLERQLAEASAAPPEIVVPPRADNGPAVPIDGSATERLAAARRSLEALLRRFTPEHPDVVNLTRVIASLEIEAAEEARQRTSSPRENAPISAAEALRRKRVAELKTEIDGLDRQVARREGEIEGLREQVKVYQARVEAAPTRESELAQLTRDYETLRRSYESLLAKKEESRLAQSLEQRQIGEQFKVLDPARVPEKPISPKRAQLNFLGIVFGLGLGLGLGTLRELMDTLIRTEQDVISGLSLPVLALVPVMTSELDLQRHSRRRMLTIVGGLVLAAATVGAIVAWKLGVVARMGL